MRATPGPGDLVQAEMGGGVFGTTVLEVEQQPDLKGRYGLVSTDGRNRRQARIQTLGQPHRYTGRMVRKANFVRNAASWRR